MIDLVGVALTEFPLDALKTERARIGEEVGIGMLWLARLDAAIDKLERESSDA